LWWRHVIDSETRSAAIRFARPRPLSLSLSLADL